MNNPAPAAPADQEHKLYPETRRLVFLTFIKKKLLESTFALQEEPDIYTPDKLMSDLLDIIAEIGEEEQTVMHAIFKKIDEGGEENIAD
ncbi:hypothetical protein [Paenibacillus zanthoxyli]|uniref:hypothetical protein n=1 Tax=Paenibacillus zanthoxyli TaxID=369399 RepID=UPI00046FC825|nr:hypothetical protein [Paenibacillus zanthoxyli]